MTLFFNNCLDADFAEKKKSLNICVNQRNLRQKQISAESAQSASKKTVLISIR